MRTTAPQLLPLFRSDGQGRLLARVYIEPDRPAPLAHLARELELDDGGITREADRLERAGLVRSERVGRSRILHPNEDSPYYRDLYGLLLKAFGPATAVGRELARIEGIERAYLFGSWAARYVGEEGPDPADIDVIAIGEPSQLAVARAERELLGRLGREVNVTIVSPEAWEGAESGFLQQVRERPLVPVHLVDSNEQPA
jgi:predicted nucleotidyltransferase